MTRRRRWLLSLSTAGIVALLAAAHWSPRLQPGPKYVEVNLKMLGQFDFDPTAGRIQDVPAWCRALDGQRVCLQGEIYDAFLDQHPDEFQLVYSVRPDSFHRPRVQERIFAKLTRPADVKSKAVLTAGGYPYVYGTFHVAARREPWTPEVLSLYTMDVDGVSDQPPPLVGSAGPPVDPFVAGILWTAAAVIVIWAAWLATRRRQAALARNPAEVACPVCGYDVRATPLRCPKCGAIPPRASA